MVIPDPSPEAALYVDQVRARTAQLGVPSSPAGQVARAIELIDESAQVAPSFLAVTGRRPVRAAKRLLLRLIRWYALRTPDPVSDLGYSVSWMGRALQEYVTGLEAEVAELRARVDRLESR